MFIELLKDYGSGRDKCLRPIRVNVNAIAYYESQKIYFLDGEIVHVDEDILLIQKLIETAKRDNVYNCNIFTVNDEHINVRSQ